MYRPFLVAKGLLGIAALTGASLVASEVFAWQHGWHPALGAAWTKVGTWPLYPPWAIWQWAQHWFHAAPGQFQTPALAGLLSLAAMTWPLRKKPAPAGDVARWASAEDLKAAGLYAHHGAVLGTYRGRTVRHDGPTHMLVVAPTRSGKTSSTAIPTLLEWQGSLVAHDPKNELFALTAGYRSTFSKVIRLDPTSPTSDCFNPLEAIRLGTMDEIRDMSLLAEILIDPDGEPRTGGSSQHFSELAMDVHTGVGLHGLYTRQARTLRELDDLYMSEATLEALLKEMEGTRHTRDGCHPAVRRAVRAVGRLADRELSGVLSTASRGLRLYLDPLVARMTNASSFTWQDLRERTKPMTLYLTVPYSDQQRLRPLSRLLIRQLLGYTTHHLHGWRHRLLGVIDEVQALNRLQALSEALNYAAGYGVNLCLITPSLHELDRLYGPNNNFLEGCHVRVAYAPNDFAIARRFSQQTGEMEVEKVRQSWSQDVGTLFGSRKTTSTEPERKPLLSPTAFMQLHAEQVLLLVGNMPPALLTKARYWKHRLWRRRSQIPAPGGQTHAA
jgi:type IV secretion system protein VirD4